jgi:hypothetical protein
MTEPEPNLRIFKPEFAEKPKSKNAPIPSVTDALAARDRELDDLGKRLLDTADGDLDCAIDTLLTAVSNAMQLRIAAGEFRGLNGGLRLSEAAHDNASSVFYATANHYGEETIRRLYREFDDARPLPTAGPDNPAR